MEISIEKLPDGRFIGILFIDNEEYYKTIEKRPGCCARTIMNYLSMQYGAPSKTIKLNIEGW